MNRDDLERVMDGDYEHARKLVVHLAMQMPEDHIIRKRCEHLLAMWDEGEMPPQEAMQNVGAVVGEFVSVEEIREARKRLG